MASLPRRIVLTGAESTGKTTLAVALAKHYGIPGIPEFAREYAESRGGVLTIADAEPIAVGQLTLEQSLSAVESAVLDTDLLSTWIYARYYYQWAPDWIDHYLRKSPADLYLLCDTDLAWVPDPIRDSGASRIQVDRRFREELASRSLPMAVITGFDDDRLQAAIAAVERAAVR